ncbi:MAG: phage major capsid protein [Chloroflexi bacterium]|nr:phage major capsid protein [Chloroflexota bacterium]
MNETIRAALRAQIEQRQAVNALADDAPEEEARAAQTALEAADQALVEALEADESDDDGDAAELRDRISLGRYLTGIAEQSSLDGAEGELRAELNLSDEAIPLEAMLPTAEERALERRADAVSPQDAAGDPLPSGDINRTTGPLLSRVFTRTDAAYLGIAMPTVPAGERRYPVMVGGTTASMQARGASPDAGAAKFDVVDVNPHRLTGRYVFDLEGIAEMGGLLERTLRADLRTEMGFQLDTQLLAGTGADNEVEGLLHALTLELPPGAAFQANDVSAVLAWDTARKIATDGLDGKFARTEADIRLLIGGATYTLARTLYRNANAGDAQDAIFALAALGTSVRRSFQIPAPAVATISPKNANSTKAVQSAIANMEPMAAVAPVWQGITMIRDPYTNAGKGQVVLTAHMLFGFALRRKDGWKRYAIRTQA